MSNKNSIRLALGREDYDSLMRGGDVSCCYIDFPKWNPKEPLFPKNPYKPYHIPWTAPWQDEDPNPVGSEQWETIVKMLEPKLNENTINQIIPFKFNKETQSWAAQVIIPGIKKDKVKVNVEDDGVKVIADNKVYSLKLPQNTNAETLTAKLEDGILSLTIKELEKKIKSVVVE